jgi:16S rRNA (adenine1518-N6/adenine1519-N6)-dimethyltransferase
LTGITRSLGQHMLADRRVLAKIVDAAKINKHEVVLEAGTGRGILTAELCKVAGRLVSYEVDKKLYGNARAQLQFQNLELVNADLFKTINLNFDVFVSNLPYSRSRDAFEWIMTQKFKRGIVMVQQEFADKLAAKPGSTNYRSISTLAGHCFTIEKLFGVDKESFEPQPKVQSIVIRIIPVNTITRPTIKNLHLLFSKRNRKASTVAARAGLKADFGDRRIDQLAPADLVMIAGSM